MPSNFQRKTRMRERFGFFHASVNGTNLECLIGLTKFSIFSSLKVILTHKHILEPFLFFYPSNAFPIDYNKQCHSEGCGDFNSKVQVVTCLDFDIHYVCHITISSNNHWQQRNYAAITPLSSVQVKIRSRGNEKHANYSQYLYIFLG